MGIFDFFKKPKPNAQKVIVKPKVMSSPDFGAIQTDQLDDYYQANIQYGKRNISVDINFEVKQTINSEFQLIMDFIKKIPEFDIINNGYIALDFNKNPSRTIDYLNFYLDELDSNEIGKIIDLNNTKESKTALLRQKLKLNRVGIYPQADYFGTFDYSIDIDGDPCNQLLVVNINKDGSLNHITWES